MFTNCNVIVFNPIDNTIKFIKTIKTVKKYFIVSVYLTKLRLQPLPQRSFVAEKAYVQINLFICATVPAWSY